MYRCVIFDLDGTLFDTSPGIVKALRYVIEKEGLPLLNEEDLKSFVGPPLGFSFEKYYSCSDEDKLRYVREFRDYYQNNTIMDFRVYEGIDDLLNFLSDHELKVGIATHKRVDLAKKIVLEYPMGNCFKTVRGNDDIGSYSKCEIIMQCITDLEEEPRTSLYVGDTEGDASGANEAGVDFIAVTYGFGFSENYEGIKCGAVCTVGHAKDIIYYLEEDML